MGRDEELYPTITLHSLGTQAKCHFCNDDVAPPLSNYKDIGAPSNCTTVYCLDGSVLSYRNDTYCDSSSQEEQMQQQRLLPTDFLEMDDDSSLDDNDSFYDNHYSSS